MNKIPKHVYQTFISTKLPEEIVNIIKNNKKMCPDYKFIFYDDAACEIFIKNNFDKTTYDAYMKINKVYGAMKADFFRYCILYKKGGVYLDIKSSILKPLSSIIRPEDNCILDLPRNDLEPWRKDSPTYEQWILMFEPNHPYLLEVIQTMVHYIHSNYIPVIDNIPVLSSKQKILNITGPDMFSKCISLYIKNNKCLHRNIDYTKYFVICTTNYKRMYTLHNKLHYDNYNEPLYK